MFRENRQGISIILTIESVKATYICIRHFFCWKKKSYVWEYQESGCKNLGWVDILTLQVSIYNNLELGNNVFSLLIKKEGERL